MESISCKICFDIFGEDLKRPRNFPCGHCFCHSCIETLIKRNPICPLCREDIKLRKAEMFPVNFLAVEVLQDYNNSVAEKKGVKSDSCDLNELQREELNKIKNIKEEQSSFSKLIIVTESGISNFQKEIEIIQYKMDNMQQHLKELLDHKEKRNQIPSETEMKSTEFVSKNQFEAVKSKVRSDLEIVKSELLEIGKTITGAVDIQTMKHWLQSDVSFYAVEKSENGTRFGLLEVKNGTPRVNCFVSDQPPHSSIIMPFRDLLSSLTGSSEMPGKTFFQFRGFEEELIVKTDEALAGSPRVLNFLYFTSGLKGPSYKDKRLNKYWNGSVACISCLWTKNGKEVYDAVVDGILDGGIYEASGKRGFVCGDGISSRGLSLVSFCLKDRKGTLKGKFGEIQSGIQVLNRMEDDSLVESCGFVIG